MTSPVHREATTRFSRPLIEVLVGYGVFCALGLASRFLPVVFVLFVAYGIAFPLVWAKITHSWQAMGFSRRNLSAALAWGVTAGVAWAIYTCVFFRRDQALPPLWGLQIAIAVPIWFLVMSPFQEFFFRGWLQPRLEAVAGKWGGLGTTAVLFTLWHFFPRLEGTATASVPLSTPLGVVSIILAGLLFGYIFRRTGSILAPWLAHAIGGIALVLIGEMQFIQYAPIPAAVAPASTAEATAHTMRYRDPYLGFAVEYPPGWEVTEHWEHWEGPTPRPFTRVGFRSNLYMGGEQAFGLYGVDVAVGEATRSTVTDTVAYHLHAMIPEVRDDIQTHCCMTVDREQAMELLGFPWGRSGCRRIVVLHNGRQYWLTFYPYNAQFNTPSDRAAREAFELFLRSFTFVPVTEFPTPTITPVPTPTS